VPKNKVLLPHEKPFLTLLPLAPTPLRGVSATPTPFPCEETETEGITKTGNGQLRKLLTESSWHYARPNQVGKRLEQRRVGTDEQTIRYADKAMKRLHETYIRMVTKGKLKQTAVIAVARELAGFIWGIMNHAA
jgi:hypothetical protein